MIRKTATAACGALLAVTLGACGGGTTDGTALTVFGDTQSLAQAASAETSKAQSAKFTLEMPLGQQVVKGHGAGSFVPGNPAMAMTMDAAGQQMEMRFVDKTFYLKIPNMPRGMGDPGKPWVKITPDGGGPFAKMLGPMAKQMGEQTDPSKMLERIQKAGAITKSEQTELGGQPVSHYWIELDLGKVPEMSTLPEGMPQELIDKMKQQFAGVKVPMQLWLNSDSLPVKITMDMAPVMEAVGKASGQPSASVPMGTMTMTYSDWGKPVDVQAPPADKVGELKMPQMPN